MVLVSQDENVVINFDNVTCIRTMSNYIHAYLVDGKDVAIATYDSEEKTNAVFKKIFVNNSASTIKMPQE